MFAFVCVAAQSLSAAVLRHLKLLCSRCTPELSEWLGGREEISRPELTSFFWDYVKRNELQVGALPG